VKSKLTNVVKGSGFKRASSDGAMSRFLKHATNDFSVGFLIGKAGRENIISVQWGIIHHPMWELQQDVEGSRDINIQFLLFSETINPAIETNGNATNLDFEAVSAQIKNRINFIEEREEKIIDEVINALKSFTYPTLFSSKKHLLFNGMAHYYGLLYKHLHERVFVEEIDYHIKELLESGLSERSIPVFRMGLLRSYVDN
jgi:hypothetical protein